MQFQSECLSETQTRSEDTSLVSVSGKSSVKQQSTNSNRQILTWSSSLNRFTSKMIIQTHRVPHVFHFRSVIT